MLTKDLPTTQVHSFLTFPAQSLAISSFVKTHFNSINAFLMIKVNEYWLDSRVYWYWEKNVSFLSCDTQLGLKYCSS